MLYMYIHMYIYIYIYNNKYPTDKVSTDRVL